MTEDDFWRYISYLDKNSLRTGNGEAAVAPLVARLSKVSQVELESFSEHLANALYELDTRANAKASDTSSGDAFLYARCYVVGFGREFYYGVLSNPVLMPSGRERFEWLLSVSSMAWSVATQRPAIEWNFRARKSFESGSNRRGWGHTASAISIQLENTKELINEMVATDLSQKASLGTIYDYVAHNFASGLISANFQTAGYSEVFFRLTPLLAHGHIKHIEGEHNSDIIRFKAGIRPRRFLDLAESERVTFFINIIADGMLWLAERDQLDKGKIEEVRELLLQDKKCNAHDSSAHA